MSGYCRDCGNHPCECDDAPGTPKPVGSVEELASKILSDCCEHALSDGYCLDCLAVMLLAFERQKLREGFTLGQVWERYGTLTGSEKSGLEEALRRWPEEE